MAAGPAVALVDPTGHRSGLTGARRGALRASLPQQGGQAVGGTLDRGELGLVGGLGALDLRQRGLLGSRLGRGLRLRRFELGAQRPDPVAIGLRRVGGGVGLGLLGRPLLVLAFRGPCTAPSPG